ncbi:hypothetical protein [Schaalia hyovaginalis]|uniref:Uncharacterized protein n=1 Tax=Schaalia hyovaginalis TaxID=29316 RepID=A0A923E4E4_9ACTO|nr:hypothetical protein [Schaalia hyovaginalis]MBB6334350.1 hypothetical protein [Schaalia hyovaginalis]
MSRTIVITDPLGPRLNEPIEFTVEEALEGALWRARTDSGAELLCQRLEHQEREGATSFITVASVDGRLEFTLEEPLPKGTPTEGITALEPREADAYARLDTGYFDLELCTGTARGDGASKWGIRHFSTREEGIDLLPSGNNAIGGFYGPFFTPENGLINPPEHTPVTVEVLEWGPVLVALRMTGTIPDGLLEELKGKSFSIEWRFTYGTPWFSRRYLVDPFATVINGRSIVNKITVGDEFEGGQGELVFDRFDTPGGVRYRDGDPYAGELAGMVAETLAAPGARNEKFRAFREALTDDIESAHWDLYWRLFSAWEGALSDEEIAQRLGRVRAASHRLADLPERPWRIAREAVDVQRVPHETIFPGAAQASVEYHSEQGRAMIWWTSEPSGQFQIVQRRQSGWVNWGTNGENECPELPVGALIKTAYGRFAGTWERVAAQLGAPPEVRVATR